MARSRVFRRQKIAERAVALEDRQGCWYWIGIAARTERADPWYAYRYGYQPSLPGAPFYDTPYKNGWLIEET